MSSAEPIRILAVAGSLREASINRRLVRLAARLAPDGVELVEYDLLDQVEPYDEDVEADGFPPGAAHFAAALREADGMFVATPEYNGSVPGQLKNALDWASRPDLTLREGGLQASPMFGRPVAVTSASNGQFGAVWARDELVKILRTQGARTISEPSVTVAKGHEAFDEDGNLGTDITERLIQLLDELAAMVAMLREARARAAEAGASPTSAAAS